ncbi:MAG: hypothetical protein M3O22_07090 [Pseudomonadota bacterium]|nr:hypothetical protein [Pseudomonadota bacterium]
MASESLAFDNVRALVRPRDRSAEILQRAARIVAEKRQQREDGRLRVEKGIEGLAVFVRKVQQTGVHRALRDYPQIRIVDQSHFFSIQYRGLEYTVMVNLSTGALSREVTYENAPSNRVRSQSFDEEKALDDIVEHVAQMIAKAQMRE